MQRKKYFLLILALTGCFFTTAQCLSGDTLWKRIDQLAKAGLSVDIQLQKLLELQEIPARCKRGVDTADAYVLQRIGVMYYYKSDFQKAAYYTIMSLELLQGLKRRIFINPFQELRCYRNLNIYCESLGWTGKYIESTDSCIAISMRSGLVDSALLYSISDKMVQPDQHWRLLEGLTICIPESESG